MKTGAGTTLSDFIKKKEILLYCIDTAKNHPHPESHSIIKYALIYLINVTYMDKKLNIIEYQNDYYVFLASVL